MAEDIMFDPLKDQEMEEVRDKISENIFIELDIVCKSYLENFGDDVIANELSFIQSNFAFLLRAHSNKHTLYDLDLSKVTIPKSQYTNEKGEVVDKIYMLNDTDKVGYFTNLLLNIRLGISELLKSGYFSSIDESLFLMPLNTVLDFIMNKINETLLRMNIILNKL